MQDNEMRKHTEHLKERDAHRALSILETLRNMANLVDTESPEVLEAMIRYFDAMALPGSKAPKHRLEVRAALRNYIENALREQRMRQRMLMEGITGESDGKQPR
jgi:hypothetical protein